MERDTVINRPPAVAGSFYPASPAELKSTLDKLFLSSAPSENLNNIAAIISPHAGYVYSGTVAASAFNQLSQDVVYDNIFLIGSSHHVSFDGAALYSIGNYVTPLGLARVNLSITKKLLEQNPEIFKSLPDVQANEHSLEVQIPFLQYLYKDKLQIVPIVIATQNVSTIKKIADALAPFFSGHNLFVISTDFSHYPDYQDACETDQATAKAILKNSTAEFVQVLEKNENKGIHNLATSICGWTSVLTLLYLTESLHGAHFHDIQYMNSGDAPFGDKNRVVGYHAMVITLDKEDSGHVEVSDFNLSPQEKSKLLRIARVTIEDYLESGKIREIQNEGLSDNLLTPSGAFVTLTKDGKLRGCIGQFTADKPLYKVVQEMAIAAATRDYRFSKVSREELNSLDIEISVLTPMRKIKSVNDIILGKNGIYIKKGNNSGTFLPQVATQTGWNLEEFLGHCAQDKAGIGWDGWKDADIYVYDAYIFGEH